MLGVVCKPLVAISLATVVGACALASGPAPNTYELEAPRQFTSQLGSSGAQLAVTEPTVVGALDSERIVVRPSTMEVTYLARSQWSDRTPKLVQARLIEAFQNSGRIRSVGQPGGAVVNDIGLVTDLHAFHIDAASNTAVIDLSARLVRDSDGRVAASQRFKAVQPLSGSDAGAMVAGLNQAFDQVANDVVAWTLGRI